MITNLLWKFGKSQYEKNFYYTIILLQQDNILVDKLITFASVLFQIKQKRILKSSKSDHFYYLKASAYHGKALS